MRHTPNQKQREMFIFAALSHSQNGGGLKGPTTAG